MPYSMEYYYNGTDKDDKVPVKVYDFACVGQLCPTALVYTLDGKEPNSNGDQPVKNTWLVVSVSDLKPAS